MRRALTAFAALSLPLALCVAPGPASSAGTAPSTVKITRATAHAGGTTVRGKVTSGTPSCKKNRKVTVYHDVAPDGPSAGDFRLGTVRDQQPREMAPRHAVLPRPGPRQGEEQQRLWRGQVRDSAGEHLTRARP